MELEYRSCQQESHNKAEVQLHNLEAENQQLTSEIEVLRETVEFKNQQI